MEAHCRVSLLPTNLTNRPNLYVQVIYPPNDAPVGSTIGPMLSQALGVPAADVGIPVLSMHSIRGITGSKDPGLGVQYFESFLQEWASLSSSDILS